MRLRHLTPCRLGFLLTAALSLCALASTPLVPNWQQARAKKAAPPIKRFHFKIDPKTPLRDLLPTPPRMAPPAGPLLGEDLDQVPQVHFQEPLVAPRSANLSKLSPEEAIAVVKKGVEAQEKLLEQTAHQIAKINFLNKKQLDHFIAVLVRDRPDLAGLPFVMGADCRLTQERCKVFTHTVQTLRGYLKPRYKAPFWERCEETYPPGDASRSERKEEAPAVIATLMQFLPVESPTLRQGLAPFLARYPEKEASQALVRLALFDADEGVRKAALDALEKRGPQDVGALLLQGLQYPWPAVARNAASALVHLKRTDLVPTLVDLLDQPDPRAPVLREVKGKKVPVVRELVRINHHRNCLLCHAPGNTPDVSEEVLLAGVPIPGSPLSPSGYRGTSPDVVVRADVTYLRQDFSRLQRVPDSAPWPEMQRFDFLVRTRTLTDAEATKYRAEFARLEKTSPYREAALTALRSLTGQDAEPTAAAWRQVLGLPKPGQP
jgi:hypothetical protein